MASGGADPTMVEEAREWIEAVIGCPLEGSLHEALKSGVHLCNLVNVIQPGACKAPTTKKMAFMQMENIAAYLAACTALGIQGFESFQTIDLFEDKDMKAVVLNVHALGRVAQKLGFAGPMLGAKMATENRRSFTEAQLQEARNAVPTFGLGSQHAGLADAASKLGQGDA